MNGPLRTRPAFAARLFGLVLVSGAAAWLAWPLALRQSVDTSLDQLFPSGSGTRAEFDAFDAAFGTDDALLLVVEDGGRPAVFRAAFLAHLDALTSALAGSPRVASVVSLSNMEDFDLQTILGVVAPTLPRPLLPPDRSTLAEADIQRLREDPFLHHGLLSEDSRAAACWVLLDPALKQRPDYLQQVEQLIAELPPPPPGEPISQQAAGFPLVHGATLRLLFEDARQLLVVAVLAVAALALLSGVTLRALAAFLLAWPPIVLLLLLWWQVAQRPLHLFSHTLLPLLLVQSTATLVHLGRRAPAGSDRWTRRHVRGACLVACLTTAVSFLSLTTSSLAPLSRLGLEVAVGSFVAFAVTAVFLAFLAEPEIVAGSREPPRPPILRGASLLLLLGVPWFLVDRDRVGWSGDFLDYLPAEQESVRAVRQAQEKFGGQTTLEIIVELGEGRSPGQLQDPSFYAELAELETAIQDHVGPRIPFILSPVTLLRYLNTKLAAARGEEGDSFRITTEASRFAIQYLIRPYLMAFTSADSATELPPLLRSYRDKMRQLLSRDGRSLRLGCRVTHLAPAEVLALKQELETQVFPEYSRTWDARIYVTGYAVMVSQTTAQIRASQLRSLGVTGAILTLILACIAGSVRLFALAFLTNAASVLALLNFLWIIDLPLNLYTCVLLAALLGVVADDSIHLLLSLRAHRAAPDPAAAANAAVRPALVGTSWCLIGGFATFFLSRLPVYREFALGAVAGVFLAMVFDVGVLATLVTPRSRPPEHRGTS